MGPVHQLEGNTVTDEAVPSEHRPALRGCSREKRASVRVRVPRPQRVPADARAEEALPRVDDPQHHLSIPTGTVIHAQAELLTSRFEAREPALLP